MITIGGGGDRGGGRGRSSGGGRDGNESSEDGEVEVGDRDGCGGGEETRRQRRRRNPQQAQEPAPPVPQQQQQQQPRRYFRPRDDAVPSHYSGIHEGLLERGCGCDDASPTPPLTEDDLSEFFRREGTASGGSGTHREGGGDGEAEEEEAAAAVDRRLEGPQRERGGGGGNLHRDVAREFRIHRRRREILGGDEEDQGDREEEGAGEPGQNAPAAAAAALPPLPPQPPQQPPPQQQQQQQPAGGGAGAGAAAAAALLLVPDNVAQQEEDDLDREWVAQQERDAERVVRAAVMRYAARGDVDLDSDDLRLVNPNFNSNPPPPPLGPPIIINNNNNLQQQQQRQQRNIFVAAAAAAGARAGAAAAAAAGAAAGNNNAPPLQQADEPAVDNDRQQPQQQQPRLQQQAAEAAQAAAVAAVRRQVHNPDGAGGGGVHHHFTFRRIFIALLAVVTAFVCIMLQTMPVAETSYYDTAAERERHVLDQILGDRWSAAGTDDDELSGSNRAALCPNLSRDPPPGYRGGNFLRRQREIARQLLAPIVAKASTMIPGINDRNGTTAAAAILGTDCSNGVLHIPPPPSGAAAVVGTGAASDGKQQQQGGFDKIWILPCRPVEALRPPQQQHDALEVTADNNNNNNNNKKPVPQSPTASSSCFSGEYNDDPETENGRPVDVCEDPEVVLRRNSGEGGRCFRGVHDKFASEREVNDVVRMGSTLISMGADHFDVHYDLPWLEDNLPSLLRRLKALLQDRYHMPGTVAPVAFRVNAAAPMDADSVPIYGIHAASHPLVRLLNRTNYLLWMEDALRRNQHVAKYYYTSLPWPFRMPLSSTKRDTCNLMADTQADERFQVLTSIFLSNGAGSDYRGGTELIVDPDDDFVAGRNQKKIRRGLTIDGARGRLLVSSGGLENRRCRLPIHAGIRATLQVWWGC